MSDEQDQGPADDQQSSTGQPSGVAPPTVAAPIVADRYKVEFHRPCPEFDTLGGTAYAASDRVDPYLSVYALACHPGIPLRSAMLEAQEKETFSHILCVEASEVLPRQNGEGLARVLIFPRPEGGAID